MTYSSIGARFSIYRRGGSSIWGGSSWNSANARQVRMRNSYNGGLASHVQQWNEAASGELKHWAVGLAIHIHTGRPSGGGTWLTLTSVESVADVLLPNGEQMNIQVAAGSFITDSSIW